MQFRNTTRAYGWISRALHWMSVLLVMVILLDISGLDVPPKLAVRDSVVARHAVLGQMLLALMLLRLAWRLVNPNPVAAYALPAWHRALATWGHRALYVLVIGLCVSGLVAQERAATALGATTRGLHDALVLPLLCLVAAHALKAIYNQAIGTIANDEDDSP